MKKIKNNKGFALAEILAVTLVLMVIFTVLYSNFMPLSGEYAKAENYNDISSQYELHYFRKIFKEYAEQDVLGSNNYKILIDNDINECENIKNKDICNSLKDELNPTLILTKYNIKDLKNELKNDTNKLDNLRTYILNLPDYNDRNVQQELYRLIIKTNYGYATTKLYYIANESTIDNSGANAPLLTSNMIPVYYDETNSTWKKADENNSDASNKWYDYDNKMWANAVTVTSTNGNTYLNASAGTEIPMSDINTMWVWIPRYTYTYLNTNTPEEIQIKFESGTNSSGTIKCTDAVTGASSVSETCTDSTNGSLKAGTSTYTHPAFWWDKNDNNVRESGEELTGIWVGKFEVSSNTTCTPDWNNAIDEGCNLQSIRPKILPNVTSWGGAQVGTFFNGIYKMRETGNQYGFKTTDETHMIKNMEWGAVTYLSHSKYGINKEVARNSASTYITGCGPQSDDLTKNGDICNEYYTSLGQMSSTTGNVYGIYDMSGGANEYVMGNMVYINGQMLIGYKTRNNYNSGLTGVLSDGTSFTGIYSSPKKRYYDKYSYGTSNTEYTRGKLGDATKEMAPTTDDRGSWYKDWASFISKSSDYDASSWFARGGIVGSVDGAGLFYFNIENGKTITYYGSRAVISNLN